MIFYLKLKKTKSINRLVNKANFYKFLGKFFSVFRSDIALDITFIVLSVLFLSCVALLFFLFII